MPGGASLDAAMSARVSQLHDARHEWEARREQAALMDLIEWLNELDQTKLDRAYITSDQFGDDFLEWYERTVHTSNTQKREVLRNALLNGATIEWQGTGLRDLFMPLVVDFSPTQ